MAPPPLDPRNSRTRMPRGDLRGDVRAGLGVPALLFAGALALCLGVGSYAPLFPWLWVFVPTLTLLSIGFATAFLCARAGRLQGVLAGVASVLLIGGAGAILRYQSTVEWTALAGKDIVSIEHRPRVPLLESISVSGNVQYVSFSPALYDSIDIACGDDSCLSFGRLDRAHSWTEESIRDAVAKARLRRTTADTAARINMDLQQQTENGVVTIQVSLRDSKSEFAVMRIHRPEAWRMWSGSLPKFLYYVLEHNPLSARLYPHRPEASKTPLADFLRRAIDVAVADPGVEKRMRAHVVRAVTIQPRRVRQGSPEAIAINVRRAMDPACGEHVTIVPAQPGELLGYLTLANSPVRIQFASDSQVICRSDHVYVLTYGGGFGMHTFQRYALDGTGLGWYRVGYPSELPQVSPDSWLVDVDSIQEQDGRLTYAVDGWRREWVSRSPPKEDLVYDQRLIWQIPL